MLSFHLLSCVQHRVKWPDRMLDLPSVSSIDPYSVWRSDLTAPRDPSVFFCASCHLPATSSSLDIENLTVNGGGPVSRVAEQVGVADCKRTMVRPNLTIDSNILAVSAYMYSRDAVLSSRGCSAQ
jgi:hypothetical protein